MKYTITYSCGHGGTIELFGKSAERERRIEWLENNGLCPDCYKAEHKDDPIVVDIIVFGKVKTTGEPVVTIKLSGNTYNQKNIIKNMGFEWRVDYWDRRLYMSQIEDFENTIMQIENVVLSENYVKFRQEMERLPDEAKKQLEIWHSEWEEKKRSCVAPEKPALISSGKKWNGKIYGKSGNFSIYLDGEKVNISDSEADELRKYLTAKENCKNSSDDMRGVFINFN